MVPTAVTEQKPCAQKDNNYANLHTSQHVLDSRRKAHSEAIHNGEGDDQGACECLGSAEAKFTTTGAEQMPRM